MVRLIYKRNIILWSNRINSGKRPKKSNNKIGEHIYSGIPVFDEGYGVCNVVLYSTQPEIERVVDDWVDRFIVKEAYISY